MTVRVSVVVTSVATDYANNRYNVSYQVAATNGSSFDTNGNGVAHVAFSSNNKKANDELAAEVSAKVLADYSLTIDPDDIYFPAICR